MRLVRRLVTLLLLGICALLIASEAIRERREALALEEDMIRDHEDAGLLIAAMLSAPRGGLEPGSAFEALAREHASTGGMRIRVLGPSAAAVGEGGADGAGATLAERVPTAIESSRSADGRARCTHVPLKGAGPPRAIEVCESTQRQDRFVRASLVESGVTVGALVALSGALAWVLGRRFVGRPVEALSFKAKRVASGDLGGPLSPMHPDELGELALEMNAMCDALASARAEARSESEARQLTLDQLRHAERLATVGRLASGIAHELGTPLNVVSGRAKMIVKGNLSAEEIGRSASIIVETSARMTSILRQILDFARRRGPNRSEQTLGALIERVRGLLAPLARRSGVQLEVMPSSTPVVARVDPAQIEQAVTNLVMNAVAASREGSEVVLAVDRVEARPPADKGSATAPRWCARLRVIDHGAGISPENLERVLEPFFTTKPVGEGTGLGLSVTQGIVQEHDGWIDIESRLGVGSTFSLFIPID